MTQVDEATARAGGTRARTVATVRALLDDPLARHGYVIGLSSLATSVLGVAFWTVAARRFDAATVGIGAALVAVLGLLGTVAQLGLVNGFNRYLPVAGDRARWFLRTGGTTAGVAGWVAGVVFLLGLSWWAPDLVPALEGTSAWWWFPAVAACWTLFVVQDGVLAGLRRSSVLLASNLGYAVAKLVVLLVLPVTATLAVFWAWIAALPVVVAVVWALVAVSLPRTSSRHEAAPEDLTLGGVSRFLTVDHVASLLYTASQGLLPVLLLAHVGPAGTAYFSLTWSTAYVPYLLGRGLGMSLLTEAAAAPHDATRLALRSLRRGAVVLVPAALVGVVAAPLLLSLFGPEYRAAGTTLLRLLVVATLPGLVVTTGMAVLRATGRYRRLLLVSAGVSVGVLGGAGPAVERAGITGVGWLWLGLTLLAAIALNDTLRESPIRAILTSLWLHVRGMRVVGGGSGPAPDPLSTFPALRGRPLDLEALPGGGEVAISAVTDPGSGDRLVVRTASTPHGTAAILAAGDALRRRTTRRLDGLVGRPTLIDLTTEPVAASVETRLAGVRADHLVGNGLSRREATEIAARTLQHLHRDTTSPTTPATRQRWVEETSRPLVEALSGSGRVAALERLREVLDPLAARLAFAAIDHAVVHGDAWLGNVVIDPARLGELLPGSAWWEGRTAGPHAPVGLVDWEASAVGNPLVDLSTLVLSSRLATHGDQLGPHVVGLRNGGGLEPWEQAILTAAGAGATDPTAGLPTLEDAVFLGWLGLVTATIPTSPRYQPGTRWFALNVDLVLR